MAEDSLRMNDLFKTASAARWAVVAILSLIEALSITLRFPSLSEGEPGFAQMVYQSVGDSGLILVALAVLCFVVWVGVFKTASNLRIGLDGAVDVVVCDSRGGEGVFRR